MVFNDDINNDNNHDHPRAGPLKIEYRCIFKKNFPTLND